MLMSLSKTKDVKEPFGNNINNKIDHIKSPFPVCLRLIFVGIILVGPVLTTSLQIDKAYGKEQTALGYVNVANQVLLPASTPSTKTANKSGCTTTYRCKSRSTQSADLSNITATSYSDYPNRRKC